MSALWTLTRREIVDRRPLLWGTLVAALLPILARLQPWLRPELRRGWHEGLALVFGIAFPIAVAIGLGASVIGEDLAQRRLGFYFSRPLSGWTIWGSKTLAAILITLATGAAFVLPVALLSDWRSSTTLGDLVRKFPDWFLPWIALLLGLIFVAQAAAGAYRARDGLFALDIGAFAVLASLSALLVWRLYDAGASTFVYMALPTVLVGATAAALGGALQVVVGRTDLRRGHLVLSATMWGILTAGLLCAAGFTSWVLSVSPQDVGTFPWSVHATASGSHVVFWAARDRAGYQPLFLLDTATGRFDRLPRNWINEFGFSTDGRRAVWVERRGGGSPVLVLRRLDAPGSSTVRTSLERYAGQGSWLSELSDDGQRAVFSFPDRIAVLDTDSGREAASVSRAQLGVGGSGAVWFSRFAFNGNAVVGFFVPPQNSGLPLVVSTFDFRSGGVTAGPRVEGIDWVWTVRDGRALASGRKGPLTVVDASGARELVPAGGGAVGSPTFLEDGSVVAFVKREDGLRLVVWNRQGQVTLDVPPPAGTSIVAGEARAGWLTLGAGADYSRPARTVFVDAHTGAVVRVEEGLTPIGSMHDDRNFPAGSPGSRLFVDAKGGIVRLDPDTGKRDPVFVSNASADDRYR
jgi:hypothetical protein